ncbi:MAG: polymer-forming cytoskeletal protein [Candidatus Paceibacterota bacterium]
MVAGTIVLSVLLLVPGMVAAETVLRVGESVAIASDQKVEEDFYAAAGSVAMSGEVTGDMYAIGGSVTTNGIIRQDLTALGGSVQVHGPVEDDVRVLAGDVTIAESVSGDVFVIAGSLTILSSASVAGDVFFYGGEATIAGAVEGSIMGTAERFRVDSAVKGDVDVTTGRPLILGDRASISGDVRYESSGEVVRAQNAVVEGQVLRSEPASTKEGTSFGSALTALMVSVFAALCIYLIWKRELTRFTNETLRNYSRSGVLGLGALILIPVAVVLLMLTVLGLLVGLIGVFGFIALCFVAGAMTAITAGGLISLAVTKRIEVNFMWILLGALMVQLLLYVPFVGPLIVLALFLMTLGNLVWVLYQSAR